MITKLLQNVIKPTRLYCDYAAATPLLPAAYTAMQPWLTKEWGNASAIHKEGQRAAQAVAAARQNIARLLGVRVNEVFFTASGTEANNLAILGVITARHKAGQAYRDMRVITTHIEHPSVSQVMEYLTALGVDVQYMPVDSDGVIVSAAAQALLTPQTVLVTFAYANSEVGTVQPVKQLARLVRKYNVEQSCTIVTHIDAAQAPLWLTCEPHRLGVDLLTLDAGKFHGPKGVGLLIKRQAAALESITFGGGQEQGLRAGTENVAGIVGASVAFTDAIRKREERVAKARRLQTSLIDALEQSMLEIIYNGPQNLGIIDDTKTTLVRLPNNVHISLPGLDTEYAVVYLDKHGIAASTKSACSGAGGGMSSVVYAMTGDTTRASSTIRFTLDPELKESELRRIVAGLERFVRLQKT